MPPEEWFTAEVRDVLDHLYDYPYLQSHPLAERLQPDAAPVGRERMRVLRSCVIAAIEELNPGPNEPFRSLRARPYSVLSLRYVEGLSIAELARELAVSERQIYRDLRRAEQGLAALLWHCCSGPIAPTAAATSRAQLVRSEAERLAVVIEQVSLHSLLQGTVDAVARLADQQGVQIQAHVADEAISIRTDHILARQALVTTLSHAIQRSQPTTAITLSAHSLGSAVDIRITCQPSAADTPEVMPIAARQLVSRLGGRWSAQLDRGGCVEITLSLGRQISTSVLVIDDNEGLLDLFRRYLTGQDYHLIAAHNAQDGLRLAREQAPDIVILDVMMPVQDGWEVLQQLRRGETSPRAPVIVCSVLDDPQLALSLGATEFLAKPVSRDQLLKALARCRTDTRARSRPA